MLSIGDTHSVELSQFISSQYELIGKLTIGFSVGSELIGHPTLYYCGNRHH